MPPTDKHEMIMDALKDIKLDVKTLARSINGNGSPGIKVELAQTKDKVAQQEARWKYIFGIIAVIVAAVVISYWKG